MFMHVKLLNGFEQILTYKIPDDWPTDNLVGSIVHVPLQKRVETGVVQEVFSHLKEKVTFTIKQAKSREQFPQDERYKHFIQKLSGYYAIEPLYFLKRVRHFLQEKEHTETPLKNEPPSTIKTLLVTLTPEQQAIVDTLETPLAHGNYYPALIQGVTGSGKTEIYKQLIISTLSKNKSVLLLLPEVSLAVRFHHLLKQQLPTFIEMFGFHSASSIKEKRALWQALVQNRSVVIIGVHLPILLPIANLGLIIIDEEHEVGFQEKKHPKINTKEAALIRAQITNIPIVMGSATPSIASLYNVYNKHWHFFELKKRFAGAFPKVELVKLAKEPRRTSFWISKELEKAIARQLEKKEQTILFLNRRGYSFFIQCKECSHIPSCTQCSVSLTLHSTKTLVCHYCNFTMQEPSSCTSCKASETSLLKKGIGTQQVVSILEKIFPSARIARADLDTTVNKKRWQEIMEQFEKGSIDILVGTQTITKGYHFPKVTLVGILWADINLSMPIYNAAEVTLQQLIQVAGRAGRQSTDSTVIVQAMIDHPIFKYMEETHYTSFYEHEMVNRALINYPPHVRLAEIELKHINAELVEAEADRLADYLIDVIAKNNLNIILLGPAQPPVHMIKNIHSRKLYLKSPSIKELVSLYKTIPRQDYTSSLFFTPNPLC